MTTPAIDPMEYRKTLGTYPTGVDAAFAGDATYDLSDEVLCERWVENPYYQHFCGEEFFQHRLVFDRSSLTRWRNRMGEERLAALDRAWAGALEAFEAERGRVCAVGRNDLVLVTLDTVRADHLGAYGAAAAVTPALDRLAREGIRFEQASAQVPVITVSGSWPRSRANRSARSCSRTVRGIWASSIGRGSGSPTR